MWVWSGARVWGVKGGLTGGVWMFPLAGVGSVGSEPTPGPESGLLARVTQRLWRSAVVWSWVMNGLRLTAGVVVLPLLVSRLPAPDFNTYFVFLSLSSLVPILDLGFSTSIGRAVSYAMGGARELRPLGFVPEPGATGPNRELLWRLLHTTRALYRLLTLAALAFLGALGTWAVARAVPQTSQPALTWVAWGLTLLSVLWEIYTGWWNVFLRGMDRVLSSTRQVTLAQVIKITLSCVLLLAGGGLLSVPLAGLVASMVQRALARREVLSLLGPEPPGGTDPLTVRRLIGTLWPNSWRIGLQLFSFYLAGQANTLICLPMLGLEASGRYGFTLQLLNICSGMAQVWTSVKWPYLGQLRIRQDLATMRRVFWPRVWLQYLTYVGLAVAMVLAVPWLLQRWHPDKQLLPMPWLGLLALHGFLEMNYILWGTLISTENRTPFTWPIIVSNLVSFGLVLVLLHFSSLGLGAMVLAPLVVHGVYNHWKWPREGARGLGTGYWRFLFRGPGVPG
ncbi:hypothetical protein [Limisphaera ngatamarikiensis]|uniref:hypothetical protein n=1 Tax=Limisphaera ngatamarikiensis TaxID=1324935 RepID=UPI0013EAA709|nr:hypothetical protein [Limisphaera ngatamarikiensis]